MRSELAMKALLDDREGKRPRAAWSLLAIAALALAVPVALQAVAPWLQRYPDQWTLPLIAWVDASMRWLIDLEVGDFKFTQITRAIAWLLNQPLGWLDRLLVGNGEEAFLGPLPWVLIIGLAIILGHYINGWRLALLAGLCLLYVVFFGQWEGAMRTLSVVLLCVPVAVVIGLLLGIASARSRGVERVVTPILNVMQSIPHFAYFIPIVFFFGIGASSGAIAIILFALPPMVRCTTLGLQRVPAELIEAGTMSGCTPFQLMWKVRIPAAKPTLMLGINQVIMQTFAMVVIASLIGVRGLGYDLLFSLQNLRIGLALEQGIAIVLIAITLDRLSRDYAVHQPWLRKRSQDWMTRHAHLAAAIVCALLVLMLSAWIPFIASYPSEWTISTASFWDRTVRWITDVLYDPLELLRTGLVLYLLRPIKDFYVWVPWSTVVVIFLVIGYRIGGYRLAAIVGALLMTIVLSGLWIPTALSAYLATVAVVLCVLIGVPVGVLASRYDKLSRWVVLWCDTFQTFPSFVYLIPVVMLFRAGDVAAVLAVVVWAVIPITRYTNLGLRNVPPDVVESAKAAGATPRQIFWRIELPLAFPEIMLGLNQTILFALFMVIIAALIGTQGLGREILQSLTYSDIGRGLMAGLSIAFLGIIADRLIGQWSARRKEALGLS